jgi:uncharacterized integral membrane protein
MICFKFLSFHHSAMRSTIGKSAHSVDESMIRRWIWEKGTIYKWLRVMIIMLLLILLICEMNTSFVFTKFVFLLWESGQWCRKSTL